MNDDVEDDVEDRVEQIQKLLCEKLGPEWEGKTMGDLHEKIEELMGRPTWTHEMAYPEMLIEELRNGKPMDAFKKSVEAIAREKPVIMVVTK